MCSIFGTNIKNKEKLKVLAVTGEVRGTDATGIVSFQDDKFQVLKSNVKASELDFDKIDEGNFYLGHTRKTTQGNEKDNHNNHPFVSKDKTLILAHNGIINNDKELWTYKTDIETDSYAVMQQLEKEKGENSLNIDIVKTVCEKLRGSFTLTIYDKSINKLYLLRHSNPLEIMYNAETGQLVYASLSKMIRKAYGKETNYNTFIGSTEEDYIYEFDLNTNKFTNQMEFSPKKYSTVTTVSTSGYRKSTTYYNSARYFNKEDKTFNLNMLQNYFFKKEKPSNSSYSVTEYKQCEFCGIWFREDTYVKSGHTEQEHQFCAYCWEGEQETLNSNHIITEENIEKAKEVRNNLEGQIYPKFEISEEEFVSLNADNQMRYTFCSKCKKYYLDEYDIINYDKKTHTYVCIMCQQEEDLKNKDNENNQIIEVE